MMYIYEVLKRKGLYSSEMQRQGAEGWLLREQEGMVSSVEWVQNVSVRWKRLGLI